MPEQSKLHSAPELTRKEIKTVTFKIIEGVVPQIKINDLDVPVVSCSYQYATSSDESEGSNIFLATALINRTEQITLTVDNLTGKTTFQ